ncbi:hypothetical protein OBBRIDRAFT_825968 [Obba rivulosa]|uniref:F-box domain-containing protein n=1 Tax=Obba rivulosa TaxID=1052685 RepID=A0A8E2DKT3_9APHY|nr:hypothetical protein OBBRIDRAFT_825968 [Obba rivulosa]
MIQDPTSPKLAPELFDIVIDFLHDDHVTLHNCSLTCRAWLPSCRFHLFRSVSTPAEGGSLHALNRLIKRSPYISQYIKELSVELSVESEILPFVSIAGHLEAVEVLDIKYNSSTLEKIRPADLTGIEPVRTLKMSGLTDSATIITVFINFFTVFRHVQELWLDTDLCYTYPILEKYNFDSLANSLAALHLRRIQASDTALEVLLPCLRLRPMDDVVEFRVVRESMSPRYDQISEALPFMAQSLEGFVLNFINDRRRDPDDLVVAANDSFKACPLLERLVLYIKCRDINHFADQFQCITDTQIRYIDLIIGIHDDIEHLQCMQDLVGVLEDTSHFSLLHHLSITLRPNQPDLMVEDVRKRMPEFLTPNIFDGLRVRGVMVTLKLTNDNTPIRWTKHHTGLALNSCRPLIYSPIVPFHGVAMADLIPTICLPHRH